MGLIIIEYWFNNNFNTDREVVLIKTILNIHCRQSCSSLWAPSYSIDNLGKQITTLFSFVSGKFWPVQAHFHLSALFCPLVLCHQWPKIQGEKRKICIFHGQHGCIAVRVLESRFIPKTFIWPDKPSSGKR